MSLLLAALLTGVTLVGVGELVFVIVALRGPHFHGWAKLSEDTPDIPC